MSRGPDTLPHVISLCGTFLKPEMLSIYRQVTGLQRVRTTVYTQARENADLFPFEPVTLLTKLARPRLKGNFILRFWFKYVVRQWPPPIVINREVRPYYPYDLVTLLQKDKPDLVHVYYGHKAVHYLEMLQAWGGPWVVSFHGVDVSKFLDDDEYAAKLKTVFAEAKLVMARSHSLLQRLQELGCPAEKLRLNRTPIPLEHLPVTTPQAPENGAWRIVQACRLIQKKGILTALKALAIVKQRYPQARYLICGDGPLKEKIDESVQKLGLTENVELMGWLTQEQLLAEYQRAHLFIHPSEKTKEEDQEGIPNSMLEAMALGLPVVATWHGGIPEAVADQKSGLLVPERTPDALAKAILSLFDEPAKLQQLSAGAAAGVRQDFGSTAQISALEEVYLDAIKLDQIQKEAAAKAA